MPTSMPTAAKAAGAATFAVVGWLVANAYVPGMPDAGAAGALREYSALVGVFVGWTVMGNSVGGSYLDSIGYGWKTVIVLIFFAMLVFSLFCMRCLSAGFGGRATGAEICTPWPTTKALW